MCNNACINFGQKVISHDMVYDKKVIELGSYNVNGTLRNHVLSLKPSYYIGVDMVQGPCVDVVCKAEDILNLYGVENFNLVISTEMMEHVYDWKKIINNMKMLCKPNGYVLITTRSYGFAKHNWPDDFWRFEDYDMRYIFSDSDSLIVEKDSQDIGVFVFAKKPEQGWNLSLIDTYQLYNIKEDRRM
jgi:SAM-dependent methyltransferase